RAPHSSAGQAPGGRATGEIAARVIVVQVATLLIVVARAQLTARVEAGLDWQGVGATACLVAGMLEAWILAGRDPALTKRPRVRVAACPRTPWPRFSRQRRPAHRPPAARGPAGSP